MKPSAALVHKRATIREAGSDLDLLVNALPGATLFDLGGLQAELEELLGISVDLVTPGYLPSKFRQRILASTSSPLIDSVTAFGGSH